MKSRDTYVKTMPDGSEEGRHPDDLEASDFVHTNSGFLAIRAKCMDCAHSAVEIRKCVQYNCPLWAFRMGKNPRALKTKRGYANG